MVRRRRKRRMPRPTIFPSGERKKLLEELIKVRENLTERIAEIRHWTAVVGGHLNLQREEIKEQPKIIMYQKREKFQEDLEAAKREKKRDIAVFEAAEQIVLGYRELLEVEEIYEHAEANYDLVKYRRAQLLEKMKAAKGGEMGSLRKELDEINKDLATALMAYEKAEREKENFEIFLRRMQRQIEEILLNGSRQKYDALLAFYRTYGIPEKI